jgi:hypothetical protein
MIVSNFIPLFLCIHLYFIHLLGQRPWSEWSRTDASCIQHTGYDIEQVQELYSMSEQPLIQYPR